MKLALIEARTNDAGHRIILWSRGDYIYAIEDMTAGFTFSFESDSLEEAKELFEDEFVTG